MSGMAPPPPPRGRHLTARDALLVVGIVFFVLVILVGGTVRDAAEDMEDGWERTMVMAVGKPAAWVADQLPLQDLVADVTQPLKSGSDEGSGPGGFDEAGSAATATGVPPVTPDAFDPAALGEDPAPPRELATVLVTGDSMSMPLDAEVARDLAGTDVKVERDPRVGTGISITGIVDWGRLSSRQVEEHTPEAVVMFLGANEGFPLKLAGKEVECCGPDWAAAYATRARTMMNTFRQEGAARVYWLLLPAPRDADRQRISRVVNAAITQAAQPYLAQVRILDMAELFSPGFEFRDSMEIDGEEQLVRDADGIHLNQAGADLASRKVLEALRADFGDRIPAE
jgi:hypothetical protein